VEDLAGNVIAARDATVAELERGQGHGAVPPVVASEPARRATREEDAPTRELPGRPEDDAPSHDGAAHAEDDSTTTIPVRVDRPVPDAPQKRPARRRALIVGAGIASIVALGVAAFFGVTRVERSDAVGGPSSASEPAASVGPPATASSSNSNEAAASASAPPVSEPPNAPSVGTAAKVAPPRRVPVPRTPKRAPDDALIPPRP